MDEAARAIVGNKPQEAGTELLQRRTLIEVRGAVRKHGKDYALRVPAIDVLPGEITAIVGPNGAGKTTLLHLLAGLLALDEGTLRHRFRALDDPTGRLLGDLGPSGDLIHYRREVAFVSQSPAPFLGKLRHSLELVAAEYGFMGDEAGQRADWWLKRLGLEQYADKRHRELSDGYRMRAAIALELVRQPQVLLLDEPIGPLDVRAQQVVLTDLRDIASSERWPLPIVVSSQHLHEIEAVADRIVFIRNGHVEFAGGVRDLATKSATCMFEIRCSLDDAALRTALVAALGDAVQVRDGHRARATVIDAPRGIRSSDILRVILDAGGEVQAFRDVSDSTRRLFEEAA